MKKKGRIRIPPGCATAAIISKEGDRASGEMTIDSTKPMHERSNGLGGGFTGYGIYPQYKDFYALHMFYDCRIMRKKCESLLKKHFEIIHSELTPTCKIPTITDEPIIWRYFVDLLKSAMTTMRLDRKEFVARIVTKINTDMPGAHVFLSGKNMGIFKVVGFPEDVGVSYKLEEYEGYSWIVHECYPTNIPGWWRGAHSFTLLDYSIVHNGEIPSYGASRRFIEIFGYKCTLQTDTEMIIYMMDYLPRVQELTLEEVINVIAAPFWSTIFTESNLELRDKLKYLRAISSSLLITDPFSIVSGFSGGLMAPNDRLKLRSIVAGEKDDKVLIANEEAVICMMESHAENIWVPDGGEPVIIKVKEGANEWAWNLYIPDLKLSEMKPDAPIAVYVNNNV